MCGLLQGVFLHPDGEVFKAGAGGRREERQWPGGDERLWTVSSAYSALQPQQPDRGSHSYHITRCASELQSAFRNAVPPPRSSCHLIRYAARTVVVEVQVSVLVAKSATLNTSNEPESSGMYKLRIVGVQKASYRPTNINYDVTQNTLKSNKICGQT